MLCEDITKPWPCIPVVFLSTHHTVSLISHSTPARVWLQQVSALAHKVYSFCGSTTVTWTRFGSKGFRTNHVDPISQMTDGLTDRGFQPLIHTHAQNKQTKIKGWGWWFGDLNNSLLMITQFFPLSKSVPTDCCTAYIAKVKTKEYNTLRLTNH